MKRTASHSTLFPEDPMSMRSWIRDLFACLATRPIRKPSPRARLAEDFAPFNLDVTTQDPGVEALRKTSPEDGQWGIRVVITPDDRPGPGSGGVAYVGSFNFDTDTPVYVFNTAEKDVAEAASHEIG